MVKALIQQFALPLNKKREKEYIRGRQKSKIQGAKGKLILVVYEFSEPKQMKSHSPQTETLLLLMLFFLSSSNFSYWYSASAEHPLNLLKEIHLGELL